MKKMYNDPFTVNLAHLDLHSETRETSTFLINSFILDNYLMCNKKIVIIHGRSGGVLKGHVIDVLKHNKYVDKYYIDMNNDGQTIIELKAKQ